MKKSLDYSVFIKVASILISRKLRPAPQPAIVFFVNAAKMTQIRSRTTSRLKLFISERTHVVPWHAAPSTFAHSRLHYRSVSLRAVSQTTTRPSAVSV